MNQHLIPIWTILRSREEYGATYLPLLTVKSQSGVELRDLSEGRQPSVDLSNYRTVHPGDLVVNRLWARFGAYGTSKYAGIISPAYWVLCVDNTVVDSRYLHHVLRSELYRQEIWRRSRDLPPNGFDIPWDQFRKIEIPCLPSDEQRHIADFLDAETARIEQLSDLRVRQIEVLNERAYAGVSEILIPRILANPTGVIPWPWLPEMSSGLPLVRLGYLCRLQNGVTVDGKRDITGDVITRPYLRVANVQSGHVDLSTVTEISVPRSVASRCTLRRGDVLMTEGGDLDKLGRGAVWNDEIPDCLHQNHVFALRPDPERLDGHYLSLLTQTVHGRCYFESTGSRTTNLASTNSSKILSFPIPLPSVHKQRDLARQAQKVLDLISKSIVSLERQLQVLAERRQALITAVVTGQFDVSTASGRGVTE